MQGAKITAKQTSMLALFVALFIVLERFLSINAWNMRIGFSFVALAAAGMLYGALSAGIVGAAGDVLGMLIYPTGPYFPGFTLNAFLTGMVFGLFLHKKQTFVRTVSAVAVNQLILSLFLQTLWISMTYGAPYTSLLVTRVIQCLIMTPLQIAVIWAMQKPLARVMAANEK